MTTPRTYHHGDLPAQLLTRAAELIARDGVEALSLRALANELGVSHTAPRHHFGSRQGVLTALAVQGYRLLGERLATAADAGFDEVGAAYVQFAVDHPGHFAVMHAPDIVDGDHPALQAAKDQTSAQLLQGVRAHVAGSDQHLAVGAIAAWSLVHGLATLALSGALQATGLTERAGGDLHDVAVAAARVLFAPSTQPPA
ncbi:MAG: TetR/AcrR family transcriptional regulator [Actinomycetes bacterium]